MPRTPARITQADVARAIRAAKQTFLRISAIEIRRDGTIVVRMNAPPVTATDLVVDDEPDVVM